MTPTEVLKMLKSKIDAAGLNKCNYVIETSDIEAINQALLLYDVVSSCVDKDELISDLDDRRAVGVEMTEDMWYFCRKQSAEYLLDKYKILRK